MAAHTYKCPNCGASMVFDPDRQRFVCEYCLSAFTRTELDTLPPDPSQNCEEALLYTCPSYGAELAMGETKAADFCYYCHNPIVLSGRLSGDRTPSLVVPFQFSRDEAKERFLSWIGKKKYIPADFFSQSQLEKLSGVYFPYWICDCIMEASLNGTARNIRVWRSGDTEYTETRVYSIRRQGQAVFTELTRNALQRAQVRMLEGILPFNLKKAEPFHSGYLSGFQAEVQDMERVNFEADVRKEAEEHTKKLLMDTVSGHTGFSADSFYTSQQKADWHYVLLPVWILTYRKKEELYYFAMNGQTGEICGRLPLDYRKLTLTCTGIFAAVTALITLLGGLLL